MRTSPGWSGVCVPVDANLRVVPVAGPRVLVVSLLDWLVSFCTSQGILLLKACRLMQN